MRIRTCRFITVGGYLFSGLCHLCHWQPGQCGAGWVGREYLSHELIGHISRDSTAIVGREKPAKKAAKEPKPRRKRGPPAKGEQREAATLKRLDRQVHQTAEEAIGELPATCDRGTKQNAQGYKTSRNGCKLHLDTNDIGLPITAPLSPLPRCMTVRWLFR